MPISTVIGPMIDQVVVLLIGLPLSTPNPCSAQTRPNSATINPPANVTTALLIWRCYAPEADVNYDNFYLAPDLADVHVSAIRALAERYYDTVTRYTTSSFVRLKLSGQLSERGLAPHVYESRSEALTWLGQ